MFQRRHYEVVADLFSLQMTINYNRKMEWANGPLFELMDMFCDFFRRDNNNFDKVRFVEKATFIQGGPKDE